MIKIYISINIHCYGHHNRELKLKKNPDKSYFVLEGIQQEQKSNVNFRHILK